MKRVLGVLVLALAVRVAYAEDPADVPAVPTPQADTSSISTPPSKTPKAPKPRRRRAPAAPDADVLQFVRSGFENVPAARQSRFAQVLTEIKKSDPQWYADSFAPYLATALSQGQGDALTKSFNHALGAAHFQSKGAAAGLLKATLAATSEQQLAAPASNALLGSASIQRQAPTAPAAGAAGPAPAGDSAGPASDAASAAGSGAPPPGAPPAPAAGDSRETGGESRDPVLGTLARKIHGSQALQKMVGDRAVAFILKDYSLPGDSGRNEDISFIDPALRKDEAKLAVLKAGLSAAIGAWAQQRSAHAALLVWFLGVTDPKQLPPEAKDPAIAPLLAGRTKDGVSPDDQLARAMRAWAVDPGTLVGDEPRPYLDGNDVDKWVRDFLKDATRNQIPPLLQDKVAARRRTEAEPPRDKVPNGYSSDRYRRALNGKGFTREEIFGKEGDLGVFIVGTKDERAARNGRLLSLRIVSERTDNGEGPLVNRLAIYDIRENPAYGRTFPLNYQSDQPFQVRDGGRDYFLVIGGDRSIKLLASDGNPAENTCGQDLPGCGGVDTPVTLDDLLRDRVRRAVEGGRMATLGGRDYFVGAQSTSEGGSAVFFPAAVKDAVNDEEHIYDWHPEMISILTKGIDGDDTLKAQTHLWTRYGGQYETGGTVYHLEWDRDAGMFVQAEGELPPDKDPSVDPGSDDSGKVDSGGDDTGKASSSSDDQLSDAHRHHHEDADQGSSDGVDGDGWRTYDRYVRTPAEHIPGADLASINQALLDAGVGAQVYQGDPRMSIDQRFLVVYKNGGEHTVPFDTPDRGAWSQFKSLKLVGKAVLAAENEIGVVYTDLAKGARFKGSMHVIGTLTKGSPALIKDTWDAENPADGYQMMTDMLTRVQMDPSAAVDIVGAIQHVHEQGLAQGDRFGESLSPAAVRALVPYHIEGAVNAADPAQTSLSMTVGTLVLRLAPQPMGIEGAPPTPPPATSTPPSDGLEAGPIPADPGAAIDSSKISAPSADSEKVEAPLPPAAPSVEPPAPAPTDPAPSPEVPKPHRHRRAHPTPPSP